MGTSERNLIPLGRAAELAGVERQSLRRRIDAGHVRGWKDPADARLVLVDQNEIERYFSGPIPIKPRKEGAPQTA